MSNHSEGGGHRRDEIERRESARTMADEMRAQVGRLAFDANGILTQLTGINIQLQQLGTMVLDLKTHNEDPIMAAGLLQNIIPQDIDHAMRLLSKAVQLLESYADKT